MGINFICVFDCFVLKIERRDDGVGVNEIGRGGWRRMEYFFYDFDKTEQAWSILGKEENMERLRVIRMIDKERI